MSSPYTGGGSPPSTTLMHLVPANLGCWNVIGTSDEVKLEAFQM